MAVAVMETHRIAQRLSMVAVHQFQPTAGLQQARQLGNEAGAVARMRLQRALPMLGTDHERRIRKQQLRCAALGPRRQQAAHMIEMQVREHHHVNVLVAETGLRQ